jgi:hypothetical protein
MKKLITLCAVAVMVLAASGAAQAETATAYVGTANANNAFAVQEGGNQLYYTPQPDTNNVWMNNNGSAPNVIATSGGFNRDGMKTFACADVAYGQPLSTVQIAFDYSSAADPTTGYAMGGVAINFFITDGAGHYGIWSATSGAALYSDVATGEADWTRRTLDCTGLADTASVAIYEHNGFSDQYGDPYTPIAWSQIKNYTVAGFYDYQRTPEGGFEAWNETLWTEITNVADAGDTTLNEYGITLNWGDTVGGTSGDGFGEIGDDANRAYGQAGRLIRNFDITVGSTAHDMSFAAGVVPEPATMSLLALGGLAVLKRRRRRSA